MNKRYAVYLSNSERDELLQIIKNGQSPVYRVKHAHILVHSDKNNSGKSDKEIADFIKCHPQTVFNIRKKYHEEGFEKALDRKPRDIGPIERIFDGEKEAQLIAIACSKPPEGYSKWTFKLLSEKIVELEIVESVSPKTIERTLKKRSQTTSKEVLGNSSSSEC